MFTSNGTLIKKEDNAIPIIQIIELLKMLKKSLQLYLIIYFSNTEVNFTKDANLTH